jgi:hypothetical protein
MPWIALACFDKGGVFFAVSPLASWLLLVSSWFFGFWFFLSLLSLRVLFLTSAFSCFFWLLLFLWPLWLL